MALDLDAIRRKLQQYSGAEGPKVWKKNKELGEHRFRIIPWQDLSEGEVFKERQVYFRIGKSWITSPKSFGKHDPIAEFASGLWESGKEEDKALAKKLFPQMCICAAIIDRAAEDEGPQLFVMDKKQAAKVISYILDSDYGDVTDINEGFDLKLKVTPSGRFYNGKEVKDAIVECTPKPCPLTTDKAKLEKWLKALPNVDDYYKIKTTEEIKLQFEEWLNSGGPAQITGAAAAPETARGPNDEESVADKLAREVGEVGKAEKPSDKAEKPAKKTKKTIDEELDDVIADADQDM